MTDPAQARGRPPDDENTDLFDYALIRHWAGFVLRSVARHRWLAALVMVSVAGLAALSWWALPFRYQVQARLLAQRTPLMATLSNPGMNRDWDAPTRAAREVLIRRDNLVGLIKQTDFLNRYLATRAPAVRARDWLVERLTREERDEAVLMDSLLDTLEERLWVVVGSEGTVTITFEWSDSDLAFNLVDAAVQSFIEARHASEITAVGETIAIMQGHDARVQGEIMATIQQVEQKERTLRIRSGPPRIVRPPLRVPAQDEELSRLQAQLAARQRALADLEEFRQRRIAELQAQLAQQRTMYAAQHPALVATRQAVESLSGPSPQIEVLRAETMALERDIAAHGGSQRDLAAESDAIQGQLLETRMRLLETGDPRLEYERAQLQLLVRQHSQLLERIAAARVEMDTAQASFKYRYSVITPPQMPRGPVRPYALLIVLSGLLGGFAMALFSCALIDLRSGLVVEAWQAERRFELPLLARMTVREATGAGADRGASARANTPGALRPGPVEDWQEPGVVDQVPPPQPPGLLGEAVEPLEAGPRDPARCARDGSGDEREAGPDPHGDGRADQLEVPVDPYLLLGRTQRDEHQVGSRRAQPERGLAAGGHAVRSELDERRVDPDHA